MALREMQPECAYGFAKVKLDTEGHGGSVLVHAQPRRRVGICCTSGKSLLRRVVLLAMRFD